MPRINVSVEPVEDAAAIEALGGPRRARRTLSELLDTLVEGVLGDAEAAPAARDLADLLIFRASARHRAAIADLVGLDGRALLQHDGELEATRDDIRRLDGLRTLIDERSGA